MNNGQRGEFIAKLLWPELELTAPGSTEDRSGIDGYLFNRTVQVKYDGTIARSGNVYHEIYEKSKGHPEQEWRNSPHTAQDYIFVTDGFAIHTTINELSLLERELKLIQISNTSMGFLVPLASFSEPKHLMRII